MDPAWVISIRDQCQADDVFFFFKQWGGTQKSKAGRHLNGRTYDDMPPRSTRLAPSRSHRMAMIEELTASATT
jgi:protein gp37